jgi:glyoxylase-like metal-dependent hydrolase (beta-lactamase superfamily II)
MKKWTTQNGSEIYQLLTVRSNVFLVKSNQTTALIDTSISLNWNRLQRRIKKLGVTKIDYLFLSHTHFDHAGNAAKIKEKYGAQVIVHHLEAENVGTGQNRLPVGTLLYSKMMIKIFETFFKKNFGYQPCSPDLIWNNQPIFEKHEVDWQIVSTPGHSIGSISLIVDHEIALVGDAMFGLSKKSVFTPFAEDVPQLVATWGDLLQTPCSLFIAGHGWEINREKLLKSYIKFSQKLSVNE